jgi:hypothetical protein
VAAAIFGLVGVLVGGLLATAGQYLLSVRNEYAAATVAARLIRVELNAVRAVVQEGGREENPTVLDTPVWDRQQAAFALVVPNRHWECRRESLCAARGATGERFAGAVSVRDTHSVLGCRGRRQQAVGGGDRAGRTPPPAGSPLERRGRLWGDR